MHAKAFEAGGHGDGSPPTLEKILKLSPIRAKFCLKPGKKVSKQWALCRVDFFIPSVA